MSRLFIALTLPEELKAKIQEWEQSMDVPVRWTVSNNLHITVVVPWEEVDEEQAKKLFAEATKDIKSFKLTCKDITYGPDPRNPKLIWINCNPSTNLSALKDKLIAIFPNNEEKRPFIPHITLARFPRRKWKRLQGNPLGILFPWDENITNLQLIKSELLPDGSHYKVLASADLT